MINGVEVASGGQATIYDVGRPGQLLKMYLDPSLVDRDALFESTQWWANLPDVDKQFAQSRLAWPQELAQPSDGLGPSDIAFHMPRAPQDAFRTPPGLTRRFALSTDNLMCTPRPATSQWMPTATSIARLQAARNFVETMVWLQSKNVVFGDISHNNVLWCPTTDSVFFVDCDQARFEGKSSPSPQGSTPGYKDPNPLPGPGPGQSTRDTDNFKIALWIIRVLGTSLDATPKSQPSHLLVHKIQETVTQTNSALHYARLIALWEKASRPGQRPQATEWKAALFGERESVVIQATQRYSGSVPRPPREYQPLRPTGI